MRTFALEFHVALSFFFALCSLFLYLFDLPFHYFPLLPLFFAIACYEKKDERRIMVVVVNVLIFLLVAPVFPVFFTSILFWQLYVLSCFAFTVTTFELKVVLFFVLVAASAVVSLDIFLYQGALTGRFPIADLFFSILANVGWIILLFALRKWILDRIFVRREWL